MEENKYITLRVRAHREISILVAFKAYRNQNYTRWPAKVLIGRLSPILQTNIMLSVELVANETLLRQSTSSVGPRKPQKSKKSVAQPIIST